MSKLRVAAGIAALTIAVSVTGCTKEAKETSPAASSAVVAKINDTTITADDFKQQVSALAPQMQQAVVSDPKAREEFLNDLIGIELVVQEAKKRGMDKDPAYLKHIEVVRKEVDRRVSEDARNELFNSLLKKELGNQMEKVPEPTKDDVKAYYEKHKSKLHTADGRQIELKDIEPQLKARLLQERRRELYLDYAKKLKEKATISVDEKALGASTATLGKALDLSGMTDSKPAEAKK